MHDADNHSLTPVEFDQVTETAGGKHPAECGDVPICYRDNQVISCWRFTSVWDRLYVLFTGKVWIGQKSFDASMRQMWIDTRYPFAEAAPLDDATE